MVKSYENLVEESQNEVNEQLNKRHTAEFKDFARAMQSDEKTIILKTVPTDALLDELERRMKLLESRDQAIKELFRIPEE